MRGRLGVMLVAVLAFVGAHVGRAQAPDRSVACGDGLNDLDMLQWAGFAVVMAEAVEEVREVADLVVPQEQMGSLLAALARLPSVDRTAQPG